MHLSTTKTTSALSLAALAIALAPSASAADDPSILTSIRACESGGNYTAQNATTTASGAYQFLDTTWRSLAASKGYARAKEAPASVQDAAARELFAQQGSSPWLASKPCWGTGRAPSVTLSNTGGLSSSGTSASAKATATTKAPTAPVASADDVEVHLNADEQKFVDSITAQQKKQSWWTKQAAKGPTVRRHIVTTDHDVMTHAKASFDDATASTDLHNGSQIVGHYVNTDFFQIDSGNDAGRFVSTAFVERLDDTHNGQMGRTQLADLPDYLRGSKTAQNAYLGLASAKQLVYLNAAYRAKFGHDLSLTEAYRTLAVQKSYYATLGSDIAAYPGKSNHGFGNAIDIATTQVLTPNSPQRTWLNEHSKQFGWIALSDEQPNTKELWHDDFAG